MPLRGEKKGFAPGVDVYIHAAVDPSPGLEPFRPLRDPNMTHKRSKDGSLPPVFSVNVYDVGYFDGGGKFWLLFNLQKTKEENEKLLGFRFKTTSFVPLTGGVVRSTPLNNDMFQTLDDDNIVPDKLGSYGPNSQSDTIFFLCSRMTNEILKDSRIHVPFHTAIRN